MISENDKFPLGRSAPGIQDDLYEFTDTKVYNCSGDLGSLPDTQRVCLNIN